MWYEIHRDSKWLTELKVVLSEKGEKEGIKYLVKTQGFGIQRAVRVAKRYSLTPDK